MRRGGDDWDGGHFAFSAAEAPDIAASTVVVIDSGDLGPTATIPDSHLLFTADFARAGTDLILRGDGKSVVVQDYFASEQRARLLSAEGATLSPEIIAALAGPMAPGQYAQAGAAPTAPPPVGRVATIDGDATIIRNGVAITPRVGDAILKGDVLQTVTGSIGVTFNDGSTLNLTANTRLVVNEFVYDPNGTSNSQLLDLVQGSLTFISGQIAHNGDMKIGTPVATMGIRGTVGGVTTANDGTVNFYVSQSATGAVIFDSRGTVIANVVQDGPLIIVRPVGPLQVIAEEVQKSPQQLALELSALQQIVSIQSVGQQIIQQFFQQDPNNPNPQTVDNPHTQIQVTLTTTPNPTGDTGDSGDTGPSVPDTATVVVTTTTQEPDGTTTIDEQPPIVVPIPVDLAPLNFGPLQETVDEDGTLTFSNDNDNAISVFDADTTVLTVTLTATNGKLTLSGIDGLTFTDGDGTEDATMTFSGTQTAINDALDGMTFKPDEEYSGGASLGIVTSDGNSTSTETVAITVNLVTDAPVLTQVYLDDGFEQENSGNVAGNYSGFANWSLSGTTDLIGEGAGGASQNYYPGQGLYLDLAGTGGGPATLTSNAVYGPGTYTVKFDIGGPHRDINGNSVSSGGVTDTVRVTFGGYTEDFTPATGEILSIERQVTLTSSAALSIASLGQSGNGNIGAILFGASVSSQSVSPVLAYSEGQQATAVDPLLTLSDNDSATLTGAKVSITDGFQSGADILGFIDQNGIEGAYNSSTGVLTLSGSASLADYQNALRSITYSNTSEDPTVDTRTISFQVNDDSVSDNLSNIAVTTIAITPVNDAPETTVAAIASGNEDASSIAINLAGTDVDGTIASFRITSLPANGTLYADAALQTVIVSGNTVSATNNAASVYFVPDANWSGSTSLQFAAVDNQGGEDATPESATINVAPAADAPSLGLSSTGGDEFIANTTSAGFQAAPQVLQLADGRLLFTWHSDDTPGDGDRYGISARVAVMNENGGLDFGQEFLVNNWTFHNQNTPQVIQLADGRVLFTWESDDNGLNSGNYVEYRVATIEENGSASFGDEGTVYADSLNGLPLYPQVAQTTDGRIVFSFVYHDPNFPADGSQVWVRSGTVDPQGDISFSIINGDTVSQNSYTYQVQSDLFPLSDGRVAFTWMSYNDTNSGVGLRIGTFNTQTGHFDFAETVFVEEQTASELPSPQVTQLSDGRLLVTWASNNQNADGDELAVVARIATVDENGTIALGAQFTVDQLAQDSQWLPQTIELADGRVLFTWQSNDPGVDGNGDGISARIASLDENGQPAWEPEFTINTVTHSEQGAPQVTQLADGRLLFTWHSYDANGVETDVAARIFELPATTYNEDQVIKLPVAVSLNDTDGSESVTALALSGVPEGFTISDDEHTAVADSDPVDITGWTLASLQVTPIANWNGSFTATLNATVTDTATFADTTVNSDATTQMWSVTINVNPVNDAPVAVITPTIYSAAEQTALTLKGSGLAIYDVDASSGSMTVTLAVTEGTLSAVAGDSGASVSGSGTSSLTITGTVTAINALLAAGGTSTLTYVNNSNAPSASATLTLAVNDNGNTGDNSLTGSDTATINITAVNDAPAAVSLANATTSIDENTSTASRIKVADIQVTDVDDGTSALALTGADAASFEIIGIALYLKADTALNYEAKSSYSVAVTVDDATVGLTPDATSATYTLTVNNLNEAPLSTDDRISAQEDTSYIFSLSDFGNYSDPENNTIAAVRITDLPSNGTLEYFSNGAWNAAFSGLELSAVSIGLGGQLRFVPGANSIGNGYATLEYQVSDGSLFSASTYTLTVDVAAINDAPSLTGALSAAIVSGGVHPLTSSELFFDDPDDVAADVVFTVTNLEHGSIFVDDNAVASFTGQELADGQVSFMHDGSSAPSAGFMVSVEDGNEDGSAPVAEAFHFVIPTQDFESGLNGWATSGSVGTTTAQHSDGNASAGLSTANGNNAQSSAAQLEAFLGIDSGSLEALQNGTPTVGSAMKATFYLNANDAFFFDWKFVTSDYLPYNDFAFFSVANHSVSELADVELLDNTIGDTSSTLWQQASFVAPTSGTYTFGFGISDEQDQSVSSSLYIDHIYIVPGVVS